jgi:hypothetical protein
MPQLSGEGWMSELIESKLWLDQITIGPQLKPALAQELSADSAPALTVAETPVVEAPAAALMPEASMVSSPAQAPVAAVPTPVSPGLASPKAASSVKKVGGEKKIVRKCTVRTGSTGTKTVRCNMPVASKPKSRSARVPTATSSRPR